MKNKGGRKGTGSPGRVASARNRRKQEGGAAEAPGKDGEGAADHERCDELVTKIRQIDEGLARREDAQVLAVLEKGGS